ncbi:MAG: PP2C family protein-serine/threonine phosphatase [Terracidiphilus sp.]
MAKDNLLTVTMNAAVSLKKTILLILFIAITSIMLRVQTAAASDNSAGPSLIDRAHAQDWISDVSRGWAVHEGDNPAWASPSFDDSAWETVRLDDLGPSKPGWRWYRLHVTLHENHPDLALLINGGEGTYALYLNGIEQPGLHLRSSFGVNRPIERTVPVDVSGTDLEIALRTRISPSYASWYFPQFLTASMGTPDAIESQRAAMESKRLYAAIPSIAINLLLILAGIAVFALYRSQPNQSEYLWLGLYVFLSGTSALLWGCQINGVLPLWLTALVGDPLIYPFIIAQIEFTHSFGGRRVSIPWRVYESLLLASVALSWLVWEGWLPSTPYLLIEATIVLPAALLLPILLFFWYRGGNREAGWLIIPSLMPAIITTLNDLGYVSYTLGWHRFDFLSFSIHIGAVEIQEADLGGLLFLLAIVVVMFFRFTRISREQARSTAELSAAREIQQRLVPASLPELAGFNLEAAYLPAQEVGGDFYQVLEQQDGFALIAVGDVSGKGLKAAMTGALAIGALRTLAAENLSPAALLSRLNRQMLTAQESGFITCLCVRLSSGGGVIMANAGHLSPYRRGEEIQLKSGLPLGLTPDVDYGETEVQLEPGDKLMLLSDGVVEAMNPQRELFGFERVREISGESAHDIAAAAQAFGQEDDITVLTVTRLALAAH